MSEPIVIANANGVEQPVAKKEFYVYADDTGINEIRMPNDVAFVLQTFGGIANFIRGQLRDASTGEPPTLGKFLRDVADMADTAALAAAPEDNPQ